MKLYNMSASGMMKIALGAILTIVPATATTITFSTSASPTNFGVSGGNQFTFQNANVASFSDSGIGTFFSGDASGSVGSSFGVIHYTGAAGSGVSNVVDVKLTPTVNGGNPATLDFIGTVSVASTGVYSVNFSGTAGTVQKTLNVNGVNVAYTQFTSNGVNYAIQTNQVLGTSTFGKTTVLNGWIQGVNTAPEPASIATMGLGLALAGFAARKRIKANS